ncbi:MAG: YkuS family protein, partial [Bacillota bacterium]
LTIEGYQVIGLKDGQNRAAALVVSGISNNMLQMEETSTKAPVINARGKTDNEIIDTIKQYFQ